MNTKYQTHRISTLEDLAAILEKAASPVLLMEGTRALPDEERAHLVALGKKLTARFPNVTFRSGNADGADTAFAEGVTGVDAARMEYVITHEGMGRKRRHEAGRSVALDGLTKVADGPIGDYTVRASPDLKGLVTAYGKTGARGPLGGKAAYLLRDTLKVIGEPSASLHPATAGIFFVNEADPLSGGTGHTIRVCLEQSIPVVFQAVWRKWL